LQFTDDGRPIFGLACGGRVEPYDHLLDKKIESFGLDARLMRPGFVRPVEEWMAACDVILAPAIHEPFGRSILEAHALDVPVIASKDGGFRELIVDGETGLLCDPDDLKDWIAATASLLNHPVRAQRLATAGRAIVSELQPSRHAARIESIYRAAKRDVQHNKREAA
jgi:glycosyltransferase involved in cell wall biosynthesis